MNINLISIAWAFLQIALLCSLALVVAWSLRGRRPQLATAILSGACIASLLLVSGGGVSHTTEPRPPRILVILSP